MQLLEAGDRLVDGSGRRQVENERPDLRTEEVVGAGGAEGRETRVLGAREEVEDHLGVGEVPDLRPVLRGDTADDGRQRGRPLLPLGGAESRVALDHRPERLVLAALGQERLGGTDDVQRVALAPSEVAPAVIPCPPRTHPMA